MQPVLHRGAGRWGDRGTPIHSHISELVGWGAPPIGTFPPGGGRGETGGQGLASAAQACSGAAHAAENMPRKGPELGLRGLFSERILNYK